MNTKKEYLANAEACRRCAISEPENSIHWLGEAHRWERMAASPFVDVTANSSKVAQIPTKFNAKAHV
jgi:hypothetical protein